MWYKKSYIMKILLTLFVLFFSSSVVAEVKKVDLQKSLKAGTYNRMSYDCGWSTYSQYSKVTKNFYKFAKKNIDINLIIVR